MSLESKYTHASRFAQFLRTNGSKVIDGSCKLSLTTSALCLLNSIFVEVLNKEWAQLMNLSASEAEDIAADARFLCDFMKRVSFLKLFHTGQTLRGGVDLSQFSNLTVLELRKMPTHLIIGFDILSTQLKALICSRSIYLLKEIFGSSLNGESVPHIWPELKELNLAYNYLENLDQSLKNVPNIEILDLSHNHIRNADEIQVLKSLNFVNLSYNELGHLPTFNISSCRSLTKLFLRNNDLEDLEGIDCLFNLEELDVGYNLLSSYQVLSPLDKLKVLKVLNLEGNPLYFHSRHSTLVAHFINPYALLKGFQLNGKILSAKYAVLCNLNQTRETNHTNNHQTSINTVVGDAESVNCASQPSEFLTRSVSEMSEKSSAEENPVSSLTSLSGTEQLAVSAKDSAKHNRRRKSKVKKKSTVREVLINEQDYNEPVIIQQAVETSETAVPSYIRAKELLEARRKERGEAWLIPDNFFQALPTSTPQVPTNTPLSSYLSPKVISVNDLISKVNNSLANQPAHSPDDEKALSLNSLADELKGSPLATESAYSPGIDNDVLSSTPVEKELKEVLSLNAEESSPDQLNEQLPPENDDIEVLNSSAEDFIDNDLHASESKEDISDDIYRRSGAPVQFDDLEESEEESEDGIIFVEKKTKLGENFVKQPIYITVGKNYIKEKDVLTGKLIDRLDLNVLQSVCKMNCEEEGRKSHEVHLEFDTVKSSRQKRIYRFNFEDTSSAPALVNVLQPFADAKTLKEVTLGALECVKCGSQFSKQLVHKLLIKTKKPQSGNDAYDSNYNTKEHPEEIDACPNCGNHILVEMESLPLPSAALPPSPIPATKKESNTSPDTMSAGSESSGNLFLNLFSSMKISPILKRKSIAGTLTSQDKGEASKETINAQNSNSKYSSSNESTLRRNSSDVTIISNPSQSSIAVIPDPELNLNTITEKDSQSSLSPPISQDSIYYKTHNTSESEDHVDSAGSELPNAAVSKDKLCPTSGVDNDFYSLTESSANESASHFLTKEVVSSGSENYMSPSKSAASHESKSNELSENKELDDVSQLLNILGEKRTITYDTFSEIDHRLKLHLEYNIFGDDEQLEACLQTAIVPLSTGDEFTGMFAISTKKLYIIKFLPLYSLSLDRGEAIDKAIQIVHSSPLGQLKQIKAILGNQGLTIACGSNLQVFTLVIRDADMCNTFSSLLSDFIQEHQADLGKVEFLSSTDETMQLLRDSVFLSSKKPDDMPEILLHLFAFWWNSRAGEKNSNIPVCVVITPDDIFVSRILYKKQDSCSDLKKLSVYHYSSVDHQKLSDLVSLKLRKDLKSVEISFLNETSCQQNCDSVFWTIEMETKSALFSFISALKNPWEEIFGIPLSLSCEEA
ncbi:hypothetical protein TNIN_406132 [Trichonephila inaurata madagascariensis]|uniref:Serine/threonine-protein kinase 11-interacting protein n=1 Tax=Trichonephila inaurata madagascariensis TaxID=2747483 RepID=A0A8X6YEQ3_9ARAC|nr:hypothetical protein TNIN_406132 [Trichonephila inaurata madagascariensis]